MSNTTTTLKYIESNTQPYCDDCLSQILKIFPRQQINQICNRLKKEELIIREKDECTYCKKDKLLNKLK